MIFNSLRPFLKNKAFWFAIILAMADVAVVVIAIIYAYSIVLSNYSAQALIYFMVLQALCAAVLRALSARFFISSYKKNALIQYGTFITCFILCLVLINFKTYAMPFIIAVLIASMATQSSITSWTMLSLSFGMREYKRVAKFCNQASYISSIIASFSIPVLVSFFSNNSLLLVAILMLLICIFAIYHLPIQKNSQPSKTEPHKQKPKNIRIPLYYYMLVFSILITTIYGVTQFTMRLESARYFNNEELSAFLGYFSGITNILGFFVAATSEQALRRLGLKGLLSFIPFITLISSLVAIVYPSFWNIVLLGAIRTVFGFSYGNYSAEITLNILPAEIRFIAKAKIKSIANIASMLLLVAFTIGNSDVHVIVWTIPPVCLLALFTGYKVAHYYKVTLQQEAAFKRFNILEEITPANKPMLHEIALNAIKSKDTYTVFYGLDLLAKIYATQQPPEAIYSLLKNTNPSVRAEALHFLSRTMSPSALPYLIERVAKEQNKDLQFKIIEQIARQDINTALEATKVTKEQKLSLIITNLYALVHTPKKEQALVHLKELAQDKEPHVRKMMASVIGTFKIDLLANCLRKLIADKDSTVSKEALLSVEKLSNECLIPDVLSQVLLNKKNSSAQFTLINLGEVALPYLIDAFHIKSSKLIIKTIAAIPGVKAEQMLFSLLSNDSIFVRDLIAQYANKRACKFLTSSEFKNKAHELLKEECSIIYHLEKKLTADTALHIQKEIRLRSAAAKIRFLQWLAIASRPREINQLISSLLQNTTVDEQALDKAIELLEIYIDDVKTRHYIAYIFENKIMADTHLLSNYHPDPWLEQIMNTNVQHSPQLSIVFELRAIRLFQDLPAEVLLALAEEVQHYTYEPDEVLFSQGDKPDGLYCITQGEVAIVHDGRTVATVAKHGFLGELALLDEAPRAASAIASSQCTVLYIEKDVFNRIADDIPDILRTLVKIILEYTRKNLEHSA